MQIAVIRIHRSKPTQGKVGNCKEKELVCSVETKSEKMFRRRLGINRAKSLFRSLLHLRILLPSF